MRTRYAPRRHLFETTCRPQIACIASRVYDQILSMSWAVRSGAYPPATAATVGTKTLAEDFFSCTMTSVTAIPTMASEIPKAKLRIRSSKRDKAGLEKPGLPVSIDDLHDTA